MFDFFFADEIIEYDITNEERARFKKIIRIQIIDKIRYSVILTNDNKYRTCEQCRFWYGLNLNANHMKIQRVCFLSGQFYIWKWIVTLKKISRDRRWGILFPPPLCRRPHANHILPHLNPAYLAIFLHGFTSGWGKTPHRWKLNYLMHLP